MIDIRKIKKLIQLVEHSNVSELEISEGDNSIRINCAPSHARSIDISSENNKNALSNQVGLECNKSGGILEDDKKDHTIIHSPIVGTFYLTPNPDAEPFIKIGKKVHTGDTLCIVEALKMMNHIKTEKSGTVVSILAESGKPVEFDEALIILE